MVQYTLILVATYEQVQHIFWAPCLFCIFPFQWPQCHIALCGQPLTLILPRSRTGTVWFYTSTSQQQESSTTKTVHKVINKGLKTYV